MRSGYREHLPARQRVLGEPLGAGDVPVTTIQYRFHERIPAGDDVPHDPYVRLQSNLLGAVTRDELDALRIELSAHRRIDVEIAPGHPVAGGLGEHGDTAHESAADAEDVNVHGFG